MDDTIHRYIERALEIAQRSDEDLSDAELAEIAAELGLTDDDLAKVEQAIEDHVERGRGYLRHVMWDDAIREFEDANTLAPGRLSIRLELAEALAERGDATDYADDRSRAADLARGILEREANNNGAFALLARLEGTPTPTESAPAPTRSMIGFIVLAALCAVAGGAAFIMLQPSPMSPLVVTEIIETTAPGEVPKFESGELDLPTSFEPSEGLAFHALRSRLANYPGSSFYTLWGDFEVVGDYEFARIDLRVTLLDDAGQPIEAFTRSAWATHEAKLRKGDHGIFTMLIEAMPEAHSARLEVSIVERQSATGPYAEARVMEPIWLVPAPEHLKLTIGERSASFSTGILKEQGFFKASWEFENTGEVPIRSLSYEVNLYDAKNVKIDSRRKIATFSSNPSIEPGGVFLESTVSSTRASYDHYEIVITEFE